MNATKVNGIALAVLAVTTLGFPVRPSLGQTPSPLRGEVFIAGKTLVDPPPEESKNSHAYLTVSGAAALRMYQAMRAPEEPNQCTSGKLRRVGALTCAISVDGRRATCDFSIDLTKGALDPGRPC